MRAIIYCRVSTVEQAHNLSLPIQEKACRDYCDREGYDVARVFVDRGESAKTTQRPEFQALLAYCRQHRTSVQAVVVYGLSRFSRNNADHHAIAALLRSQGIALRSVTEPIDDSPAGRFMEAVLAGMAQFDNDLRADRTKVGMRAAVARGRWVWKAPLGYRNGNTRTGESSLVPDGDRAALVRTAFGLVAAGVSQSEMQRQMTARGLTTPHGRPVPPQTWTKVLRNPLYVGRLLTGLGPDRAGDWEPLIDAATFARVQVRLGLTPSGPRLADSPDFTLRQFVRCAHCQRLVTGAWSRGKLGVRYGYYHCRARCISTRREVLEGAFQDALRDLALPQAVWLIVRRQLTLRWHEEAKGADDTRGRAERAAATARARLRRLDDAYLLEAVVDRDTYTTRRADLRAAIDRAEAELAMASGTSWDVDALLDYAIAVTQDASRLWTMAPTAQARIRLQWVLFPTGLSWDGSAWSNPQNCWSVNALEPLDGDVSQMASPAGVEPASPP